MHRRPGNVEIGERLVQEGDERAHEPALGLPLFAQEEKVVSGDQSEVDLWNDRVVVADDSGKSWSPRRSIARKLSRTSCLTVLETHPLSRSSLRVEVLVLVAVTR